MGEGEVVREVLGMCTGRDLSGHWMFGWTRLGEAAWDRMLTGFDEGGGIAGGIEGGGCGWEPGRDGIH